MLAGLCAFISLTVLNYAVSVGTAAVAISIFNCSAAVHVLIASIFLGQQITGGQISGVVLAIVGVTLLTMGDLVIQKLFGTDEKESRLCNNQACIGGGEPTPGNHNFNIQN